MDSTARRPHRRARHVHSRRLRRRQRRPEQSLRARTDGPGAAVDPAAVGDRLPGHARDADDLRRHRAVSRVLEQPGDPPGGRQRHRQPGRPRRQSRPRPTSPRRSPSRTPPGSRSRSPSPSARRRCSAGSRSRPARPECGSANLCSGATGTASVTAKGVAGAPLAGRQIRFDVVYGPFAIQSTSPATPLVQTLTVVTDTNGAARVGLQADVNATTQPAQIRATDLTTGQQVTGNFTVVNSTVDRRRSRSCRRRRRSRAATRTSAAPASRSTTSSTAATRPTACRRRSRPAVDLSQLDRQRERRPLQRGHQRHLRQPADVHRSSTPPASRRPRCSRTCPAPRTAPTIAGGRPLDRSPATSP